MFTLRSIDELVSKMTAYKCVVVFKWQILGLLRMTLNDREMERD